MRVIVFAFAVLLLAGGPSLAQQRGTGLLLLPETQYQSIPLASSPLLGDIPAQADLSAHFPRPGDQGTQQSCVGWASAYVKDYQEARERRWSLALESNRFSPAFVYNQIKKSADCQGGTYLAEALALLRRQGIATLTDFPYRANDCSALPNDLVKQRARQFNIADFRRVNVQDVEEVKTQVASGFPVLIGMYVDGDFQALRGDRPYRKTSPERGTGHAMAVVGYSDAKNAFKVINSWGEGWGVGGFGWIDYDAFRRTVVEAYTTQDVILQKPESIDPSGPGPESRPAEAVYLGAPVIIPNQNVEVGPNSLVIGAGSAFVPGMRIEVPGQIKGLAGRKLQVLVTFSFLNGPPLMANPAERVYRDGTNLVTTASKVTVVGSDSEELRDVSVTIPYYALNLSPTNYSATYDLVATANVFIDDAFRQQSQSTHFQFRW